MSVYLDASALVSLFVYDAHSLRAEAVVKSFANDLAVSDFAVAEYSAALTRRVRTGALRESDCDALFDQVDAWQEPRRLQTEAGDVVKATALVRQRALGLRAPDALHLAIALREGAQLLTFDARMARGAAAVGIPVVP